MPSVSFPTRAASSADPIQRLVPVAPGVDFTGEPTRGIYVGGAGVVAVTDASGGDVEIISGDAQYHPIRVVRIRTAGTTATGILALY